MEQKALKDQLKRVMDKANADIKATAAMTEKKADEIIQKYRTQAQTQGEGLLLIQVLSSLKLNRNNIEEFKRCI